MKLWQGTLPSGGSGAYLSDRFALGFLAAWSGQIIWEPLGERSAPHAVLGGAGEGEGFSDE